MNMQRSRESGVVSIMVTMIMMIVISLIVLGFAEVSRVEQRSSLDDHLSTQAYYAAESGINDARAAIVSQLQTGAATIQPKTTCNDQNGYNFNATGASQVSASNGVSYSCVLIDPNVSSLVYDIGYASTVIPIESAGGAFGNLTLQWNSPTTATTNANCYTGGQPQRFPPVASWLCAYPVLRIDIADVSSPNLPRTAWDGNTQPIFLVPYASGGTASINIGSSQRVYGVNCTTSCQVRLNGLGGANSKYYWRVTTLYRSGFRLTVTAPGGKSFIGAEAQIDVTGKAQDVLRRVRVAIDLTANSTSPSAAIVTRDSICKRFDVTGGSFDVSSDVDMNNSTGADGNILCSQQTHGAPSP